MRNLVWIVGLVALASTMGCSAGGSNDAGENKPFVGAELTISVQLPPAKSGMDPVRIVEVYSGDEQIGSIDCSFGDGGASNFSLREGSHSLRFESRDMQTEERAIRILSLGSQSIHIKMVEK